MRFLFLLLFLLPFNAVAELTVRVSPPKITGQKAIVLLAIENHFPTKIESVRAAIFILDETGKMLAQGTQWIIGGSKDKPGLSAGSTNVFQFVVTSDKPLTTNVTSKVVVNRIVLEGGNLARPNDVKISPLNSAADNR